MCFIRVSTSSGSRIYLQRDATINARVTTVTTGVLAIGPVFLAGTVNNAVTVDTAEEGARTRRLCVSGCYYSSSLVTQCTEGFGYRDADYKVGVTSCTRIAGHVFA